MTTRTRYNLKSLQPFALLCSSLCANLCLANHVNAADYISPSMVNIPAGSFTMGHQFGNAKSKPMKVVTLPEFQMSAYPITVAEFRKFVIDTGFNPKPSCSDYIGKSWFNSPEDSEGTATWEKHRFQYSDYQPVTCITWQEANEYAKWLSNKTGNHYRLPTEQEFEYALKANTTTRFFWGNDENMTQACKYGNFADQSGEHIPNTQYGASYVGFLNYANCDDGEAYNSIVGLYRPNPFGLYDMVGNVSQYLSTCYYDGHDARSDKEMDNTQCEHISHRGGTWHFPPLPHADRQKAKRLDEDEWALMGFRLAADGSSTQVSDSTVTFLNNLKTAQKDRIANRPKIPKAPTEVRLVNENNQNFTLTWQPNNNPLVSGYTIYKSNSPYSHLLGGFYKNHYEELKSVDAKTNSIDVGQIEQGTSFKVTTQLATQASLPSQSAHYAMNTATSIPGKVNMQHAHSLDNVYMSHRAAKAEKPELYYLSRFHTGYLQPSIVATFNINVKESNWYTVNYRGRAGQEGEFFKLWSNNIFLGSIEYDKEIDDKTSNRHKIFLEKGIHNLELNLQKEGREFWNLVWLDIALAKP